MSRVKKPLLLKDATDMQLIKELIHRGAITDLSIGTDSLSSKIDYSCKFSLIIKHGSPFSFRGYNITVRFDTENHTEVNQLLSYIEKESK